MGRPYHGPKLWLDPKRDTWTICDGRRRVRTGHPSHERDKAVIAIHQYSNGNYNPERPRGPEPVRPTPPRRGVYVVGFGPYVKIGLTTDLDQRLSGLQPPEPLVVYGLIEGWRKDELALHARFAAQRLNGEWFRKEGELASWIEAKCPPATS